MKIKKYLIVFIITLFSSIISVDAFSTNLTSKNQIYLNDTFTVNIALSNLDESGLASGQYYLNYDSSKVQYVNYTIGQGKPVGDFNISNDGSKIILLYIDNTGTDNPIKNGIFASITFKALQIGETQFTVSGSGFSTFNNGIIDLNTNNAIKTISIVEKPTTTTTKATTTTTTKVTTTKPETPTTTKIAETTTKVEEPTTVITNQVTTEKVEEDKLKNDNSLKKLNVKDYEINYTKDLLEYSLTVPFETEKLEIEYEATSSTAIVELENKDLVVGENEILIKVTSSDQKSRTYKIKVLRSNKYIKTDFNKINLISLINEDNKFIEVNIDINEEYKIIEKEIINLIKEKEVEVKFNINDNKKNIYYMIINKENIGYIKDTLDLTILKNIENKDPQDTIYKIDNKKINKNIKIYFNVEDISENSIYVYSNKMVFVDKINLNGNYIELNLENDKIYFILTNEYNAKNALTIILTILFIILLILTILMIIIININNQKPKQKTIYHTTQIPISHKGF